MFRFPSIMTAMISSKLWKKRGKTFKFKHNFEVKKAKESDDGGEKMGLWHYSHDLSQPKNQSLPVDGRNVEG